MWYILSAMTVSGEGRFDKDRHGELIKPDGKQDEMECLASLNLSQNKNRAYH